MRCRGRRRPSAQAAEDSTVPSRRYSAASLPSATPNRLRLLRLPSARQPLLAATAPSRRLRLTAAEPSPVLLHRLSQVSLGCAPETNIDTEAVVSEPEEVSLGSGYACDHADEGKRRSLATGSGLFCVAVQTADPTALQAGLNWACGPGHADCTAIQPGGPCYKQNNLVALASYAYNDYYHRNANTGATCTFNATAMTTPTDPSSGQCVFAGSSMAGGSNSSTTPAANAPAGLGPPSSFTPGFGGGSTFGSPTSIVNPLDGAGSVLSGARRALCVLLLVVLPLFFF